MPFPPAYPYPSSLFPVCAVLAFPAFTSGSLKFGLSDDVVLVAVVTLDNGRPLGIDVKGTEDEEVSSAADLDPGTKLDFDRAGGIG